MMHKTDAAILLIKHALNIGIKADYVLMDTWFTGGQNQNRDSCKDLFVRNRNKKSECLYILSTDISLSDAEIVRIYGNRWSIECFFKSTESFLKLGTEFQSHNYGAMVSRTTIVFTRYIMLEDSWN